VFSDGQDVENYFQRIGDYFKHRLIDPTNRILGWVLIQKISLHGWPTKHISFLQTPENDIEGKGDPLN
jgi:hypothetical protein